MDRICQIRADFKERRRIYEISKLKCIQLSSQRKEKENELADLTGFSKKIKCDLIQWQHYDDICKCKVEHSELKALNEQKEPLLIEIAKMRLERRDFQNDYVQNSTRLTKTYTELIKKILAQNFSGIVSISKGELKFDIDQDGGYHGEAVETLSFVIADFAAMLSRSFLGFHPGFLLHDSPREADLDRQIYDRYFQVVLDYSNALGGSQNAPFQYIITTTSSPPDELEKAGVIVTKLKSNPESEMLFGRSLRGAEAEQAEMALPL